MYARLNADGTLQQFPYTLDQLIADEFADVTPSAMTSELAKAYGVVPVEQKPSPAYDHTLNASMTAELVDGKWIQVWSATPATDDEIDLRTNQKRAEVRMQRNHLLFVCDWTQLPDAPVDRATWATYRQALRDVTAQPGFPWSITWPDEP